MDTITLLFLLNLKEINYFLLKIYNININEIIYNLKYIKKNKIYIIKNKRKEKKKKCE